MRFFFFLFPKKFFFYFLIQLTLLINPTTNKKHLYPLKSSHGGCKVPKSPFCLCFFFFTHVFKLKNDFFKKLADQTPALHVRANQSQFSSSQVFIVIINHFFLSLLFSSSSFLPSFFAETTQVLQGS